MKKIKHILSHTPITPEKKKKNTLYIYLPSDIIIILFFYFLFLLIIDNPFTIRKVAKYLDCYGVPFNDYKIQLETLYVLLFSGKGLTVPKKNQFF